ncbi:MAG TPA: CbiX/SirB N-terminal domain-containing protein [Verrucomicrobiae bacterium]|nr:CbiX/SirB N-terminal domain-containing protein [Verrucomicrobiae bacterium]
MKTKRQMTIAALAVAICCAGFGLRAQEIPTNGNHISHKIAVMLVGHGSRSATWRQALLDMEASVRPAILTNPSIQEIKTAFMEYTEPSIATRLKELDREKFADVIIVPVFLTISPHTFDDIPTIIGEKADPQSLETMRLENIERYQPKAHVIIAPNLDFSGVLRTNVLRRVRALSTKPTEEGVVLIAYGDTTYAREWSNLLDSVGVYVKENTGIDTYDYGWCGHIVHYDPKKTTEAVEKILQTKAKALVIPVLVAKDEEFQIKIIGGGIGQMANNATRVIYKPDAILPDPGVERWVIAISRKLAANVQSEPGKPALRQVQP